MSETEELESLFDVKKILGEGAFGKVYQCFDRENGMDCAVKVILKDSLKKSKLMDTKQQAGILAKINHNNIVKHYDMKETDKGIYIKMQVIKHGSLAALIRQRKKQGRLFKEEEVSVMMKAILQGVSHIHSLNIIHRDLKTQNILVSNPEDLSTLKIADFGLSIKVNYQRSISTQCGTFLYMAPEILLKLGYSKAVDIYSCAIVMYTLFTMGQHPFYHSPMDSQQYIKIITTSKFPNLPNQLANNFLHRISSLQPIQRYKAHETLNHPWITRRYDDPIPISSYQNFKGFQNHQQIKTAFSALFGAYSLINKTNNFKKVSDLQYLQKVQLFNKQSCHRAKKLSSAYGSRLTKQAMQPFTKIIKHQRTQTSIQTVQQYDKTNPAIEKLNKIFTCLFERKQQQKPTSGTQKIQQLIQKSAFRFKRQNSNRKKIFQKKQIKSSTKLSSTDTTSFSQQLKPTRTSINLREFRIVKKQHQIKPIKKKLS